MVALVMNSNSFQVTALYEIPPTPLHFFKCISQMQSTKWIWQ